MLRSACAGVTFVDTDYKELMGKKRDVVINTPTLHSMLTNVQLPRDGDVFLHSDEYAYPQAFPFSHISMLSNMRDAYYFPIQRSPTPNLLLPAPRHQFKPKAYLHSDADLRFS
jgi:hypothetical protein